MDTINDVFDPAAVESDAPLAPRPKADPIESRFLFVDVAAMRAKQLRRGALSRLDDAQREAARSQLFKAERIAMEEVRQGLVPYDVPQPAVVE